MEDAKRSDMKAMPAKPRKRLSPDARRRQLRDVAMKAFAAAGIERAVHADVAALAGVSTPTVFKYFPTRDALVDDVLDRVEVTITDLITQIPVQSQLSVADMLYRFASGLDVLCLTEPDLMKVALAWSVAFSSVRERYITFQEQQLDMLQARLGQSEHDRSDARILMGVALLYTRMHFDGTSDDVRRRYVDRLTELWAASPDG
ncbi:TetR/AcrR family transcriptional regulator [Litorimonas sp. WD9-15]|uniref:TetR/AcrR family transcriptional regulator n=1 Tax=Litorimonas sp. WD9-15 TaxID=3418716 RepID=UPI003D0133CD